MSVRTAAGGVLVCLAIAARAAAQAPTHLTLADAEAEAARNHPRILAAQYNARAASENVREIRSAYLPTVVANTTGAESVEGTRIAAGGLNNPTVFDRFAYGVAGAELLTDFGRTPALAASAALRLDASRADVEDRRAAVLLQVDGAYFDALRAQAVLRVASETVTARQLVVDQSTQLAAAGLKSALDVTFATVALSQAKLLLLQATNDAQAADATLAAAIGAPATSAYQLEDVQAPPAPPTDSAELVAQALRDRPDVARERFSQQSEAKFAIAERDLRLPTMSMLGAAGLTPFHETGIGDHYAALGVNVSVPIFTGGLFSARHAEALFHASAQQQAVRDLEDRVARDVRIAWLNAQTSFQRLDLTNQLLSQATEGLDLAQERYTLGLSSIVELTQAQLNLTEAQIEQAAARYEYAGRSAALRFQTGALK
jgi:outer membrane protein